MSTSALRGLLVAVPVVCLLATACDGNFPLQPKHTDSPSFAQGGGGGGGGGGGKPPTTAGNNLSFPVIWSDGVTKALRGTYGTPDLNFLDLWYVPSDGTFPIYLGDGTPPPNPLPPGDYAYQQQGPSTWQAESADWSSSGPLDVRWIDWGDNLESVDWYTRSMVRTEVVLIQDLATPMLGYEMLHLEGWGIDELWGVKAAGGAPVSYPSLQATVYSGCARLAIQRLNVLREDPALVALTWDPTTSSWTDPTGASLINAPIFNKAVYEGGDGPGYYSAEINVKGKVIYGYTWNVRSLNDGAGDYRVTFSLDTANCPYNLNTFFVDGVTEILPPAEEEAVTEGDDGSGGGAVPEIDFTNDLTYIDVRILQRGGGAGGGSGKPTGGGKGKNN